MKVMLQVMMQRISTKVMLLKISAVMKMPCLLQCDVMKVMLQRISTEMRVPCLIEYEYD